MAQVSVRSHQDSGTMGYSDGRGLEGFPSLQSTERALIEKTLLQLYPRLKHFDSLPWKWMNGPLIPDFIVRHTDRRLRRIVEIGCGDGVLSNILSLLYPEIEIIGIDAERWNIATARATIGQRQNLKFIHANAAILAEIPCDRIIYNGCLAKQASVFAFKKLLLKTSQWLVDEGDLMIKESPVALMQNLSLMKGLFPLWRHKRSLEACLRSFLNDLGYATPLMSRSSALLGWPSEIYGLAARGMVLNGSSIPGVSGAVGEWDDWQVQSDDSLLGFLFSKTSMDFSKELI